MRNLLIFGLLFLFSLASQAGTSYGKKISMRTGAGALQNAGTAGGQTSTFGGINLVYTHFLLPNLSAGVGYRADFDLQKQTMPVWGYDFSGRFYFLGRGTTLLTDEPWGVAEYHDPIAYYVGLDYSKREYFFGPDTQTAEETDQLRGDFSAGVITVGLDYHWFKQFEFNGELSYAAMPFAASDSRYKIQTVMVSFGLNYVFK